MDWVSRVQILVKVVCIFHYTYSLVKDMNPSFCSATRPNKRKYCISGHVGRRNASKYQATSLFLDTRIYYLYCFYSSRETRAIETKELLASIWKTETLTHRWRGEQTYSSFLLYRPGPTLTACHPTAQLPPELKWN